MPLPQAYAPQDGYKYQILVRNPTYGNAYDHCDYAKDKQEKTYLLDEYRLAYGVGWDFKVITLPVKFWPQIVRSE